MLLGMACSLVGAPEERTIDGVTSQILRVSADQVKIIWKNDQGEALRTFPAVARYLKKQGLEVQTLINAGIFEPGGIPSGLLIQDGKTLCPVNPREGRGNFFLQPNGIFMISSKGASVIRTDEYSPGTVKIRCAVQSGPLLLRKGKLHPRFNRGSTSRLHRNGVGVAENGEVVFAISDIDSPKFPNLYEFAQLFRILGCDDALFLDGDLSTMRSGEAIRQPSNAFGAVIAVVEPDG